MPSGFALCPSSPEALPTLKSFTSLIKETIGPCEINRQPQWIIYRLENVPRTVRVRNDKVLVGYYIITPIKLGSSCRHKYLLLRQLFLYFRHLNQNYLYPQN